MGEAWSVVIIVVGLAVALAAVYLANRSGGGRGGRRGRGTFDDRD